MKRLLILLLMLVPGLALAQTDTIANQAQNLASLTPAPENLNLRFSLLGDSAAQLTGQDDQQRQHWLGFFSDTRTIFWSHSTSQPARQRMVAFEDTVKQEAASQGVNLDLPPVGTSPLYRNATAPVAAPPAPVTTTNPPVTPPPSAPRYTSEGFHDTALTAERLCTEMVQANPQDRSLARLQSSLTRLRVALEEGASPVEPMQGLHQARNQMKSSYRPLATMDQLRRQLEMLDDAYAQLYR
ncbi:MAG: hypothetical protein KC910_13520 [Candidatus Eremiobacteraeota bacterium]|nr:hypothetical protein [Candidatus Eremiobacteraeota bacterium]